jgi:hypothetical protein
VRAWVLQFSGKEAGLNFRAKQNNRGTLPDFGEAGRVTTEVAPSQCVAGRFHHFAGAGAGASEGAAAGAAGIICCIGAIIMAGFII